MLRLRLYDCTRLYIVKYRQCLAFGNIYIGDHFSVVREEKDLRKSHKLPFVVVLNIVMCTLDVDISVVCTTASDKGQDQPKLGKCTVSSAPCSVCGISTTGVIFIKG